MAQDEVNLGTVYLSSTISRQIHQKRISVMSPLLLSPTCLSHWVAWATGRTRTLSRDQNTICLSEPQTPAFLPIVEVKHDYGLKRKRKLNIS